MSVCVCERESLSHVWLFATPWTVAHQAYLCNSPGPFSSPGDLLDPVIESQSSAFQADSLPSELPGKP